MAKVRKFETGIAGQGTPKPEAPVVRTNLVPNITPEAADSLAASAPVHIRPKPGNPRQRRYKQKTYSLPQEDIDLIEQLLLEIRKGGLFERGRSDIVRAGVHLLHSLPLADKLRAVEAIENLRN